MFLENHTIRDKEEAGWIEVICGSMFSGKTEELIRRLKRAQIAKMEIEIFKPKVDNRYHDTKVVSHDEKSIHSITVDSSREILEHVKNSEIQVVGIDEAQFFDDELPVVCNVLANSGIRVVVAGLDMDFTGKPFGPMPYLMAIAEYVTKVHAICVRTGKLANFSHRIVEGAEQVKLGATEHYEPLSRDAFLKALREENIR